MVSFFFFYFLDFKCVDGEKCNYIRQNSRLLVGRRLNLTGLQKRSAVCSGDSKMCALHQRILFKGLK